MPVDIKLLGTSSQWKMDGPRIRIGRDPGCDIPLSAERFPMVSREHLVLVMEKGHLRFTDPGSANGTYVNGVRAVQGRLLNADRIRLGSDGPELEITIVDDAGTGLPPQATSDATVVSKPVSLNTPTIASSADAATTMMLGTDGSLQKNAAAAVAAVPPPPAAPPAIAPPPAAVAPPAPPPVVAAPAPPVVPAQATVVASAKVQEPTQVMASAGKGNNDPTRVVPAASPSAPPPPGMQATVVQPQAFQPSPSQTIGTPPPQQQQSDVAYLTDESTLSKEQEDMIEQRVSSLQKVVYLLVVMVIVLLGIVFYLQQQVQKTHDAVNTLSQHAQDAVAQFTPALDDRLKKIDDRMDQFDGKMKDAQNQMVQRLNTELPKTLDTYFDRKMKQLQQSGQLPQ